MDITAQWLARFLGGTVEGDGEARASEFAKIEHGKPGSLSFFANPKYEQYVYTSEASILIVGKDFQPKQAVKPTLVRVDDAYAAVAKVLKYAADKERGPRRHRSLSARWHLSTRLQQFIGGHVKRWDDKHVVF